MPAIDQKRIAQNTLLLYFRMGLIMLVSLYTSRIILDALGEIDFGIYNTVAGIVMMFSFLAGTMSTSCQRFFAFSIGKNDYDELKRVFNLCVIVFAAIAVVIVLLCETVGLWLLNKKIQVDGRMGAAIWVFQSAIISFCFTILRMPYQGMVVIKEKMKVFAYISIVEALGNLGIAILISHSYNDRLILYSVLMLLINAAVSLYYFFYCSHFYPECRLKLYWNKGQFKEIFAFASWNMVGSLSGICKSQGLTILLNMFFGNVVVAARAMAYKVFSTLQQFSENFIMAVKPQIIKSYSAGDKEGMFKLIHQGSKFSFFLMFIVSLPILLETPLILDVWLKDVPPSTVLFTRLVIVNALIEVLVSPLATAMQAYGNIRDYQLICGGFILLILPVSYLFLKLGCPAETVFNVSIVICALAVVLRVILVHHYIGLSIIEYFRNVVVPIILVILSSAIIPTTLEILLNQPLLRFFIVCISSVVTSGVFVYLLGMTNTEKKHFCHTITKIFKKIFSK